MSEGQEPIGTPNSNSNSKRRGRPPQTQERRKKVLVEATPHMNRIALEMLRKIFDLADVAKALGLNPKTVRNDWSDDNGIDPTDNFILTVVCERLYGARAPWIDQVWTKIVQDWPQRSGTSDEKFVAAIAAIYREMLKRPETVCRWLVHLFVASARHGEPSLNQGQDAELMRELVRLRQEFDDHVTTLWHLPLQVVLAEMGRRPKPGIDERTIARELHTSMDGHILRSLAEGNVPEDDEGESVGRHTLFLLQGFTEEDVPDQRPPAGGVEGWVRDRAAHTTLDRYRACAPSEGDPWPAGEAVDRVEVLNALADECADVDSGDVPRAFDALFPDMPALRDAALRRRLERPVEATRDMYRRLDEAVPGAVLRQILASVRATGTTDGFLLSCCRRDWEAGSSSYLADLEIVLVDLLEKLSTNSPDHVARMLLDQTLDGDHNAVDVMLKVIIPPESRERESTVLHQAAAADQVGEEGGEVGA